MAKSLVDYIFRYMASKFMSQTDKDAAGVINRQLTLSEVPVVSGEATSGSPAAADATGGQPAAAQPLSASAPTRSVEVEKTSEPTDEEVAEVAGAVGFEALSDAGSDTEVGGGETTSPGQPNGLLDGLKIVAQGSAAKDRAERLAVGQAPVVFDTADSPACTDCGSIMVRNGSCYKCINCGATSGCS